MAEVIRQCEAGHLSLNSGNWQCPWCEVERLRAKVDTLTDVIERARAVAEARILTEGRREQ